MKKPVIFISIIAFVGVITLSGYTLSISVTYPDFETVGSDYTVSDEVDDLLILSGGSFSSASVKVDWLDIVNTTFDDTGSNYTVTVNLNGDYHPNASLWVYMDINQSDVFIFTSYLGLQLLEGESSVLCTSHLGTYAQENITTIRGNAVIWTFPKINVTELVPNNKSVSEWQILTRVKGDYGTTNYIDLMPNFSTTPPNGIPGYSMLIVALILIVSVLLIFKKDIKS